MVTDFLQVGMMAQNENPLEVEKELVTPVIVKAFGLNVSSGRLAT